MRDENTESKATVTRRRVIMVSGAWAIALTLVPGLLIAGVFATFFPATFKALWPLTVMVGMSISMLIVSKIKQVDK